MKNVLITGATGGIGKSLVSKFHKNGFNVCATGTNTEKLCELDKKYGKNIKCIRCDLSNETEIKELIIQAKEYFGYINILINNAGITKDNIFIRMSESEWDDVIKVNLSANFKLTKLVIKDMVKSKWGRVVNISSDAAKIGNPGQANYVATKSAIEGLTRTIANEVASRGITVNAVSPGFIETDIIESVNKERLETMLKKVPVGRIGSTEEVASLVYFLSSEESSYITGQVIHINGGLTM